MIKIAIYRISDGEIQRRAVTHYQLIELNYGEGENYFLNCPPDATHIIDGEPVTVIPPVVPSTTEELIQLNVTAIQRHLDATARTRNYDGILSLASYASSTDAAFAAEGAAGVLWRDTCWRLSYQALADVQAGLRAMPTPAEAVAELPPMIWP